MKNIWKKCQSSFGDTPLNCYMLNVALGQSCMTAIFFFCFWTILWAILTAVYRSLHVKRQILTYYFDFISLLAPIFIVSFDRACKEVSTKKYLKLSMSQYLWFDCTFQKQSDLWHIKVNIFHWIDNDPIIVLYEFQIYLY